MIRQGEIYLVDFGKKYHSELGKKRPAIVIQNNMLNRAVAERLYPSVMVVPLTTDNVETDYKLKLSARDKLKKESYAIMTWICSVDVSRFDLQTGALTQLKAEEFAALKARLCAVT